MLAEVTAREVGRLTLAETLELTALVAEKTPKRHGRYAARWLSCYLDEREPETLEEVAFVLGCLAALAGEEREFALSSLRAVVKRRVMPG
jgi:NTP pyrophosphatase (non-canonical NTP hydrolase)